MKYIQTFFFGLLLFATASCFKPKLPVFSQAPQVDVLPPITQTGQNTIGCLVNGEVFLPKNYNAPLKAVGVTYFSHKLHINFSRQKKLDGLNQGIIIEVLDPIVFEGGRINLNLYNNHGAVYRDEEKCGDYKTMDSAMHAPGGGSGILTISHLDTIKHIICGTFSIKFNKPNTQAGCDTIRITEGRFDSFYD
jgi:hypothetical protein